MKIGTYWSKSNFKRFEARTTVQNRRPNYIIGCRTNHFSPDVIPLFRKLPPPKTKVNIWWRKHVTGSGAVDVNDVPDL